MHWILSRLYIVLHTKLLRSSQWNELQASCWVQFLCAHWCFWRPIDGLGGLGLAFYHRAPQSWRLAGEQKHHVDATVHWGGAVWLDITGPALAKRNSPFCVSSMFQKSNGCQETIIVRVIQWLPAIKIVFLDLSNAQLQQWLMHWNPLPAHISRQLLAMLDENMVKSIVVNHNFPIFSL